MKRTNRRARRSAPPTWAVPLLFEVVPPDAYAPRGPILVAGVLGALAAAAHYANAYGQASVRRGGVLVACLIAAQAPAYAVLPNALMGAMVAAAVGHPSFEVRMEEV